MPTILITGATDGLGRRVAGDLADAGWTVLVHVASAGQYPLDFADLQYEHGWDGTNAYRKSKLAQIMFTFSLAERLGDAGVTVTALHPATFMGTKMVVDIGIEPRSEIAEGARATERLIADPELAGVTGRYFNGLREGAVDPQAHDPEARERLWELSERLAA